MASYVCIRPDGVAEVIGEEQKAAYEGKEGYLVKSEQEFRDMLEADPAMREELHYKDEVDRKVNHLLDYVQDHVSQATWDVEINDFQHIIQYVKDDNVAELMNHQDDVKRLINFIQRVQSLPEKRKVDNVMDVLKDLTELLENLQEVLHDS